jgi:hypothetical protein
MLLADGGLESIRDPYFFSSDAMRRYLALVVTLFAWLLATGSHWDVVQTVAWARMFAMNSQTMPLLDAAKKTFSPDGRCDLCKTVSRAKTHHEGTDENIPGTKAPEKEFLAITSPARVFLAPVRLHLGLLPPVTTLASAEPATPLLTPPRSLA